MEETKEEGQERRGLPVPRRTRVAAVIMTFGFVFMFYDAVNRGALFDLVLVFILLVFLAPPALLGYIPVGWLGLSREWLKQHYTETFRVDGDNTGVGTAMFVGLLLAGLLVLEQFR